MHSSLIFALASALASGAAASPLIARGNSCGVAPKGAASNQPLSQPSGISTATDCKTQCDNASDCKSFCFGMVDTTIQCKLYSCAASEIPAQSSVNLVAYDKACSSVPAVKPTSSNPTGKDDGSAPKSTDNQKKTVDNSSEQKEAEPKKTEPSPVPSPAPKKETSTEPKKAEEYPAPVEKKVVEAEPKKTEPSPIPSPAPKKETPTEPKKTEQSPAPAAKKDDEKVEAKAAVVSKVKSSAANTCAKKPAAAGSNQPISAPKVASSAACKSSCEADSSCKSFTCGSVSGAQVCKLYSCQASEIPAPSDSASKNALVAYDVGCSI